MFNFFAKKKNCHARLIASFFFRQEKGQELGRWKILYDPKSVNTKVDLANEDNCGPCGNYIIQKRKSVVHEVIKK